MDGEVSLPPLPEAFLARMKNQLGAEYEVFLRSYETPAGRGIRFRPGLAFTGKAEWTRTMVPIPWAEDGYRLAADSEAGKTLLHEAGAFYLQEPSAMIPVAVLAPEPGERILDLCAAPGGKSTQIGAAMRGEGLLICNEPHPGRARILGRNIERMGIRNAVVLNETPERLAVRWAGRFDGVLVDAPCSGEGMFRRDPATRQAWTPEQAAGCAGRQREILEQAARMVRPGGRLVYSTCTFHPAENEENASWFLRTHGDFKLEEFQLPGIRGREGMHLCLPHRGEGEGQFTALFRKTGGGESLAFDGKLEAPGKESLKIWREIAPGMPEPNGRWGDRLILIPEAPDVRGLRVVRIGLAMAEIRGRILVPEHAAALALEGAGTPAVDVSEEEALKYLAGEALEADGNGWALVRRLGLNLGWGKISGGLLKNHYPKGLRNARLIPVCF